MNILVTGATGFVGSHLLDTLLPHNQIIGVSLGKDKKRDGYSVLQKDITKISSHDIRQKIDAIIHLAAITDIQYCKENPQKCFVTNVLGTQRMLEIARTYDAKLIYASTSHVYGAPIKMPINERHQTKPLSIYASTKLNGEILCEAYAKTYNMDISIVRLFSIYGPRSPPHLVISGIISQFHNNFIKIGNTHTVRDFVYITDVARAIDIVLKKSKGLGVFNIGTGRGNSILEIVNLLKKIADKNPKIKSVNSLIRQNDIKSVISDITKIRKLGWQPKISVEEGLRRTFDWYAKTS